MIEWRKLRMSYLNKIIKNKTFSKFERVLFFYFQLKAYKFFYAILKFFNWLLEKISLKILIIYQKFPDYFLLSFCYY